MVRAIDSDFVFVSSKIPGAVNIFEVNDIPDLWTKETVLKNLYLDELNLTLVNLHLPQRARPSLKESCYVVSGGKSLCQLGGEVASRLKLCSCYSVQFSVDSVILSQDTLVSTLYKEYESPDGFLNLSCNMVPKLTTAAPYNEKRKTCKSCFFNRDLSAKVPIIVPDVIAEEVPYPPFPIRNKGQGMKASMIKKSGSYGPGVLVYGTYAEGDIRF